MPWVPCIAPQWDAGARYGAGGAARALSPPYPILLLEPHDVVLQPLLALVPLQVLDEGCLLLAQLLERADVEVQPLHLLLVLLLLLLQLARQQPACAGGTRVTEPGQCHLPGLPWDPCR